jgi:hypothetical protein
VLADNKLALNAGWDNDLLKVELGELKGLDFDVELTGCGIRAGSCRREKCPDSFA